MKRLIWLTPILLTVTLLLPACDRGKDDRTVSSSSTPNAAPTKMSESDLEKAIRTKLESDEAIKQANLTVSVNAEDNKATLTGTVISEDLKNKAIDLAKTAQPGVIIEDKIDVKPAA